MDDNSGEWVESMSVASGCGYHEVSVASRWNLWVWLECIRSVVRMYKFVLKEVYRFPYIILIPTPLVLAYFEAESLLFAHFKNVFSFMFMLFLCNIASVAQKTFEIVRKSRSRRYGNIIISTSTSTTSPETSTCEMPSDVIWKLLANFVYNKGIVEVSLLHV